MELYNMHDVTMAIDKNITRGTPTTVMFYMHGCGHCKVIMPVIKAFAQMTENNAYVIEYDNVDPKYNIVSAPTFWIFNDKGQMTEMKGASPDPILVMANFAGLTSQQQMKLLSILHQSGDDAVAAKAAAEKPVKQTRSGSGYGRRH